ncbi:tRNA (adenosine(37)-N6)-threonylcarbamoyltransferase complex dimerization subunit type 1 TsaB [Ulvibacter litoralis]|uniref:tRNA threonylcarbamoyladenosine biosynthesis protein TsaB n=1 Tax=Ulvibacter litoralis TaxID=227084 RepID=A0A1G7DW69_9FLAO|nr:tRNA (adenosine(37)-N6)-threonylcarbamoyltransferase complex dimerization subunit type 1 TsaB [Ulvibacter litoralis]GHC42038.1 tRNA (adenosine(37)-N6)-threonylcarbamoyltransferase complex dimerization subunit type 1 TsaB [Ulvibacter litoralis]SDE55683.1 tRNA threonylcarbamoyladenosine biosynthesis protein TsaB [Ulvibacter litoralis]
MATLLCIETATTNCSVALSVNGSVIAFQEDTSKEYSHAERLHVFIEEVLAKANLTKQDLDGIAVSKGPGSYTGLRIGVSAAKGLCYALDIPLISIPTLQSLMLQLKGVEGCVVSMLDARRMEVYAAVFSSEGKELRETRAEILTEHSFSEYLEKGKVHFIGSGTDKFEEICTHKNAVFVKEKFPSAQTMAILAEAKHKKSDIEDVAYFEPYYLKDFMGTKL